MTDLKFDSGSLRDPAGRVFHHQDRIFRTVSESKVEEALSVLEAPFFRARSGISIIPTKAADRTCASDVLALVAATGGTGVVLEHEKIDPITYPFEWPFSLLRKAAELHLEIHLDALASGYDLSDSSAYNIQFRGIKPVFIDTLSFRRYVPGGFWTGYNQFCAQFLCPLLLTSFCGIPYNDWYRGSLNGLDVGLLAKLLPLRARLRPTLLMHVFLHAHLGRRGKSHVGLAQRDRKALAGGLSKQSYEGLLRSMLRLARSLSPKGMNSTYWKDYESQNSYSAEDNERKRHIVADFIGRTKPHTVLDLGCNSGQFSELCLDKQATQVIGVDVDHGVLEAAVSRAEDKKLNFLPLYLDLTNPSPSHGWACAERASFSRRIKADAVIALAVLHHLVITHNIPITSAIRWIIDLAPEGILEFVPKADPMVATMLEFRGDVFPDYTAQAFRSILAAANVKIVREDVCSDSGRLVVHYAK